VKIFLTTRTFLPPFTGGVDVYAERLGHALARLGHEVNFVAVDATANEDTPKIAVLAEHYQGFPVWRLKFALAQRPKLALDQAYDPEMGRLLKSLLAEQKPDLLLVLNFYQISLAAVEAAKALSLPVVHIATDFIPVCRRATLIRWNGESCRVGESVKSCAECFVSQRMPGRMAATMLNGLFSEATLKKLAEKRHSFPLNAFPLNVVRPYWEQVALMEKRLALLQPLREQIDLVFTPTPFTSDMFLANGFRPEQIHLMPFGIDEQNPLENVIHIPAPHVRFLFIGRLQPYKGVHLLVEAFQKLQNPQNATLTIYGKPDGYEEYFNTFMASIRDNPRIHFAGVIPPSELGRAFGESDYFILPSIWHENNPLILLDALQANTPVIASDVGGVRDIVKEGRSGLLFPMGDVPALQTILQKVIDQPALKSQLQPKGHLPYIEAYAQAMLDLCFQKLGLNGHTGGFAL
jgi:glycosyltransferase involved in cell wall biosynthesis